MFVANGILCKNSGNDITLLTPDTSAELGLTGGASTFNVKGIGNKPMIFTKTKLLMRVQNTKPVMIPAGAQIPQGDDDHLRDNLFGRQGILDHFSIVMSKGSIELHQTGGGGSNALGLSLPHRPIGERWDYKSDLDEGCPFSNC